MLGKEMLATMIRSYSRGQEGPGEQWQKPPPQGWRVDIKSDQVRNPCWLSLYLSLPSSGHTGLWPFSHVTDPGAFAHVGLLLRVPFLAYACDEPLLLDLFQLVLCDNTAGTLCVTHGNDCACPCIFHPLAVSPPDWEVLTGRPTGGED